MPIYEYQCPECDEQFEKLVRLNGPTPECPACGAKDVQKQVSLSGFILKGSGWYRDHYGLKPDSGTSKENGESGAEKKTPSETNTTSGD